MTPFVRAVHAQLVQPGPDVEFFLVQLLQSRVLVLPTRYHLFVLFLRRVLACAEANKRGQQMAHLL